MTAIAYAPRPELATRFAPGRRESRRRTVAILAESTNKPNHLDRRPACRRNCVVRQIYKRRYSTEGTERRMKSELRGRKPTSTARNGSRGIGYEAIGRNQGRGRGRVWECHVQPSQSAQFSGEQRVAAAQQTELAMWGSGNREQGAGTALGHGICCWCWCISETGKKDVCLSGGRNEAVHPIVRCSLPVGKYPGPICMCGRQVQEYGGTSRQSRYIVALKCWNHGTARYFAELWDPALGFASLSCPGPGLPSRQQQQQQQHPISNIIHSNMHVFFGLQTVLHLSVLLLSLLAPRRHLRNALSKVLQAAAHNGEHHILRIPFFTLNPTSAAASWRSSEPCRPHLICLAKPAGLQPQPLAPRCESCLFWPWDARIASRASICIHQCLNVVHGNVLVCLESCLSWCWCCLVRFQTADPDFKHSLPASAGLDK